MPQDNNNLISNLSNKKIKKKLYNSRELQKVFKNFALGESNCRKDILEFVDTFCKVILKNTYYIDENSIDNYDLTDLVNLTDAYANITALLQNTFSAGLMYGRAKFDEDFSYYFKASGEDLEKTTLKDFINKPADDMPSIHLSFETELGEFFKDDHTEEQDFLDDIF